MRIGCKLDSYSQFFAFSKIEKMLSIKFKFEQASITGIEPETQNLEHPDSLNSTSIHLPGYTVLKKIN